MVLLLLGAVSFVCSFVCRRPLVFVHFSFCLLKFIQCDVNNEQAIQRTNKQIKHSEEETTNDIQIVRYVLRQRKHTFKRIPFFLSSLSKVRKKKWACSTSSICIWFVGISCECVCAWMGFFRVCNASLLTDYIENVICFRNIKWFLVCLYPSAHLVFADDSFKTGKKDTTNKSYSSFYCQLNGIGNTNLSNKKHQTTKFRCASMYFVGVISFSLISARWLLCPSCAFRWEKEKKIMEYP